MRTLPDLRPSTIPALPTRSRSPLKRTKPRLAAFDSCYLILAQEKPLTRSAIPFALSRRGQNHPTGLVNRFHRSSFCPTSTRNFTPLLKEKRSIGAESQSPRLLEDPRHRQRLHRLRHHQQRVHRNHTERIQLVGSSARTAMPLRTRPPTREPTRIRLQRRIPQLSPARPKHLNLPRHPRLP